MKLSEAWLREWINPKVDTKTLAEKLTMAGLEVESITTIADKLEHVRVGQVVDVMQHPQADRLRVCQVNVGDDALLTIVCGAANVRPGLKSPVALIGAVLPGGMEIKHVTLRGIESSGMICSEKEIGISESSTGIMELPEDAPIGANITDYLQLPDHLMDIKLTPNRGDCLSIAGIAREVGVLFQTNSTPPASTPIVSHILDVFPVTVNANKDCPRYISRIIRGINPKAKTPIWMQERLRRSDIRSLHPVVDVTNYVMQELGQPLHAYDLNTISTNIQVRYAHPQEKITLLDGKELMLDEKCLVIADQTKPLALAGIMGTTDSGVSLLTTDILLESAFFTPQSIAVTARRFQISTDSSMRFERGVDTQLQNRAIERATELLLQIVGGQAGPAQEKMAHEYLPLLPVIHLRRQRILRILGTTLSDSQIENSLTRLGMILKTHAQGWDVTVPSHRFDITLEIDLIEELARIYGYEHIPEHNFVAALAIKPLSEEKIQLSRLRNLLIDHGYCETITYSFIDPKLAKMFYPAKEPITLRNPIASDMSIMRASLWPGLIQGLLFNLNRQQMRVRLFETGLCFYHQGPELIQEGRIAGIISGSVWPEQWGESKRALDFFDIKGDVELLQALTNHDAWRFVASEHPALHPGKSAAIECQGKNVGYIGNLHPNLQQQLDITIPVYLFEITLESLQTCALSKYIQPSKYPSVRRDIAVIVDQDLPVQPMLDKISSCAGELLHKVQLFDIYQGEGIDFGKKSVAMGLTFQLSSRTLIDSEIDEIIDCVISTLNKHFNAVLRTRTMEERA